MNNDAIKKPKAFISCSLRDQDKYVVNWVENFARQFGFEPFGTVGRHDVSPVPIPELIQQNIHSSDCIIIVGTTRYLQEDVHYKQKTGHGISELIHVEIGMAYAQKKPVIAFAFDEVDIGAFLPKITQYIKIDTRQKVLTSEQKQCIEKLFMNTFLQIKTNWEEQNKKDLQNLGGGILKITGVIALISLFFGEDR